MAKWNWIESGVGFCCFFQWVLPGCFLGYYFRCLKSEPWFPGVQVLPLSCAPSACECPWVTAEIWLAGPQFVESGLCSHWLSICLPRTDSGMAPFPGPPTPLMSVRAVPWAVYWMYSTMCVCVYLGVCRNWSDTTWKTLCASASRRTVLAGWTRKASRSWSVPQLFIFAQLSAKDPVCNLHYLSCENEHPKIVVVAAIILNY